MRTSTFFRLLSLATLVGATAIWFHERATVATLQVRLAALRKQEQHLASLSAERDRLREQRLAAESRANVAATTDSNREPPHSDASVIPAAFAIGEWTPLSAWKNEGRSTPRSTISTLLWAAAGGDLSTFQNTLEFDDASRVQAQAWLDTLPPETRALYATPEDLVASVSMGNITPTAAQLSWFHQTDADHAIVGLMLAAPTSSAPEPAPTIVPATANEPPSLAKQNPNQVAMLTLHSTSLGWRVTVPAAAIGQMAKKLRTTPAR